MTPEQQATLQTGLTVAGAAAPFLPPNIGLAVTAAINILSAIQNAAATGQDITDEELAAMFTKYAAASADAKAAQQEQGG